MKYAPVLLPTPTTPLQARKRTRKVRDGTSPPHANDATKPTRSRQRRVSDDFRITKPVTRRAARKVEDLAASHVSSLSGNDINIIKKTEYAVECESPTIPPQALPAHTQASYTTPSSNGSSSAAHILSSNDQEQASLSDDFFEDDDDLFNSIDLSDNILVAQGIHDASSYQCSSQSAVASSTIQGNSSLAIRGDKVSSLATLSPPVDFSSPPHQPIATRDANNLPMLDRGSPEFVDTVHTLSNDTRGPTAKFKSPVTPQTDALIRKGALGVTDRKPIVRPPFPDPVRDRSPIIGLSSNLLLRTCFRIGEAINQAGKAAKNGQNILFELYAHVLTSHRDAVKQHFVFADLFHERPPHLKGEYDATIWKPVELFNYDSGRFLSKAKMCRCIGHIKRNENKEWTMVILNIWEATWEDVEWVQGIVGS